MIKRIIQATDRYS
ncbi:hypothetical protein YPPY54_3780, partial [Yersinia pestis PY-54]